jgi:hypothetical protein
MADEMPFDILGQNLALGGHLLHLVLPEYTLSGIISLLQHLYGVRFRYRYKLYAFRKAGFDSDNIFLNIHMSWKSAAKLLSGG